MARAKKTNRSDGRKKGYQIIRVIGHTVKGEPIKKSFYGTDKNDALQKYYDYKEGIERERNRKKDMLFNDWVEKWLYTYKEPDVKPTTFSTTYLRPCKNYIMPYFKNRYLIDITPLHIKEFVNSLSDKSQSLIDKTVICLRGIFETAIDNEIVERNPCRNINVKSKAKKEKKSTYDVESVDLLCKSEHKYGLLVHILLRMGLRCSELCGLRWEDIDFDAGTMYIRQALTCEGAQIFIDEPKSINSKRKLNIPEDLLKRLRVERGEGYIAMLNGHHITPNHFGDRQLEAFYNDMKVPRDQRLSPHELRHTCGTLLYKETRDIYHVSRFLGHSDIGITTKIYVHSEMQDTEIHITL